MKAQRIAEKLEAGADPTEDLEDDEQTPANSSLGRIGR